MMAVFFGQLQEFLKSIPILAKEMLQLLGASTYHKGVDIGAPEGFEFIAVTKRYHFLCWFFRRWWIYHYFDRCR